MNKTLLAIIIIAIVLVGGTFAYKAYQKNQIQGAVPQQTTQQNSSMGSSSNNAGTTGNNAVDQTASSQEQQVQQNLNSLDNGNHN